MYNNDMADKGTKIIDSTFVIPKKRGNGTVRREVWLDAQHRVSRYNLAYINTRLFAGDHGRVLGFDNAHDFHHKHLYGVVTAVDFISFEAVEEMFEAALMDILSEARK
jgi:hypothetical protein